MSPNRDQCNLCSAASELVDYEAPNASGIEAISICEECAAELETPSNVNHWHCLRESMWSENPGVKITAWRILSTIAPSQSWAQDLLDQLYLEDDLLQIAKSGIESSSESSGVKTKDSNGTLLANGDSVTLIKDLDVKGAGFTAKRGTLVKNIVLTDDPGLIEGKVNGTQIVLKTVFLKKAT